MQAKKLTVKTYELNSDDSQSRCTGEFIVCEFENGLILVPGESTGDWFFENRNAIEACGNDIVDSVDETGELSEWTVDELRDSIKRSISEFGSVPKNAYELIGAID